MSRSRLILLAVIAAAVAAFFSFDLGQYLSLDYFKSQQQAFSDYYQSNPALALGAFFVVYVAVTALSLPGAALMTLLAGALFGVMTGTILVSFASTIGASLAFLAARFLLRDSVQKKFGSRLKAINEGIERDGAFYLFTLRLVPAFPFFMVNMLMGLTPIKLPTYFIVSQIGMLAGTVVFVNAGTQLAQLDSLSGIISPQLLGSFALLGVFPLVAKKFVERVQASKVYKGYRKPKSFDRNLIVIGAGAGGLVTSYIAAAVKAKVTLIEKNAMGGDCLNTGCVPSKALIRSAKAVHQAQNADKYGLQPMQPEFEFGTVMDRVHEVVKAIEPHDSVERYTDLGVECLQGTAKLISPWEVEVQLNDGKMQTLSARNIVVATGARPFVPPIPGLEQVEYLTSDNVWNLREKPKRLVVLGGGPIGCELTQTFNRLGSQVTQVEMLPRLMLREDPEISELVMEKFRNEGVDVRVGTQAKEVRVNNGVKTLVCQAGDDVVEIEFDEILVTVGRQARLEGFGLEELGVRTERTVVVDDFLRTNFPNIFACGDVAGPYQFTHTAAHQAWYAAVNALFGQFKKFRADYSVIPWATFTDPEVARVGLNEQDAKEQGVDYEVTTYGIDDLDRAIADGSAHGLVKVLTVPGKDKILGVTIAGEHAGDLIAEYVLAMRHGLGLNKILGTIHSYPTFAEANKYAAGEWKKAHAPEGVLKLLEKYHAWRRG
jgi:dihydrolipoamide dehydrogenase